jgi:hypothetical protein
MAIKLGTGWRNVQRWKSQRIKIHIFLDSAIDFLEIFKSIPRVWFSSGNHKHLAKVSRLLVHGFFLDLFKIHTLVWIFLWIFVFFVCVSSMFCLKLLLVLNFTNAFYQRRPSEAFLYHRMLSCAPKKCIG